MSRTYRAYLEAAKLFEWYESQFTSYSIEQCHKLASQCVMLEQRRAYGMLARVKEWRLKFEDADVLAACNTVDPEDADEPPITP